MSFGKSKDDKESEKPNSFLSLRGGTTVAQGITSSGDSSKIIAFLGAGSKAVGTLSFTGPVEIDGHVEGEIIAQDKLVIGEAAVVGAKITGSEIIVRGTVNGDITASKLLTLKKPARVIGNISSANLSIEEGVTFEGKCSMGSSANSSTRGGTVLKSISSEKIGASAA